MGATIVMSAATPTKFSGCDYNSYWSCTVLVVIGGILPGGAIHGDCSDLARLPSKPATSSIRFGVSGSCSGGASAVEVCVLRDTTQRAPRSSSETSSLFAQPVYDAVPRSSPGLSRVCKAPAYLVGLDAYVARTS